MLGFCMGLSKVCSSGVTAAFADCGPCGGDAPRMAWQVREGVHLSSIVFKAQGSTAVCWWWAVAMWSKVLRVFLLQPSSKRETLKPPALNPKPLALNPKILSARPYMALRPKASQPGTTTRSWRWAASPGFWSLSSTAFWITLEVVRCKVRVL